MAKKIILLIIVGFVAFCLGLFAGLSGSTGCLETSSDVVNFVSSEVTSFYANGIVVSINGRAITLNSNNENLVVPIKGDATVNLFVQPESGSPFYQPVSFSTIKIGDRLNIELGLSSDGKTEGQAVYIFPVVAGEKSKNF